MDHQLDSFQKNQWGCGEFGNVACSSSHFSPLGQFLLGNYLFSTLIHKSKDPF